MEDESKSCVVTSRVVSCYKNTINSPSGAVLSSAVSCRVVLKTRPPSVASLSSAVVARPANVKV